jgi:hypothetical protein
MENIKNFINFNLKNRGIGWILLLVVSGKESASVLVLNLFIIVEKSATIATRRFGFIVEETTTTTADGAGGQSGR